MTKNQTKLTKIKQNWPKSNKTDQSYNKIKTKMPILFCFWLILFWFWSILVKQNFKNHNFILFWLTKIKVMNQFCFVLFCFVSYSQMLTNNTWHSREGGGPRQCHQMTHGGGRRLAKVSHDIFLPNFEAIFTCFDPFLGHW